MVQGASNLEISGALMIAENTVKVPMRNILGKLQLRDQQQAAAYAMKTGIISDAKFRSVDYEDRDRQQVLGATPHISQSAKPLSPVQLTSTKPNKAVRAMEEVWDTPLGTLCYFALPTTNT